MNYSSFRCDFLRNEEIWKEADKCYLKYKYDDSIPVDVEYIAEKMGLDIIPEYFPESFDAFLSLDGKAILINSARDERYNSRIRFSVAHEIGHFILHQEMLKKFHFDDLMDYITFIQEISENEYQSFDVSEIVVKIRAGRGGLWPPKFKK